jgi:hypothetical protein
LRFPQKIWISSDGFIEQVMEMDWQPGTESGVRCDRVIGLKESSSRVAMLTRDGMIVEMFEYSSPVPRVRPTDWRVCDYGYTLICLEVEDIDCEYERLSKAGMTFHAPPPAEAYSGMKAIYGRDPEGNFIELLEIYA